MWEEGAGGGVRAGRALRHRGDADRDEAEHHAAGCPGHRDRQDPRGPHQLHQAPLPPGGLQADHAAGQAAAPHAAARACSAADPGGAGRRPRCSGRLGRRGTAGSDNILLNTLKDRSLVCFKKK